jgi:hypothetical protein
VAIESMAVISILLNYLKQIIVEWVSVVVDMVSAVDLVIVAVATCSIDIYCCDHLQTQDLVLLAETQMLINSWMFYLNSYLIIDPKICKKFFIKF